MSQRLEKHKSRRGQVPLQPPSRAKLPKQRLSRPVMLSFRETVRLRTVSRSRSIPTSPRLPPIKDVPSVIMFPYVFPPHRLETHSQPLHRNPTRAYRIA